MISYLSDLSKGLLNLIYPCVCEICKTKIQPEAKYNSLCQNCLNQIRLIKPVVSLKRHNIEVWAICVYEGVAKDCIHLFKYNARLNLADPLGRLMSDFINNELSDKRFDTIIPVPLHSIRLRERGFNQAEILAKRIAKHTNHPVCTDALKRIKPTKTQTGLSKTKRFTNLSGAFKITKEDSIREKKILLIDDVFTTGSTINEAAKTLLRAKPKSVEALVLARGI